MGKMIRAKKVSYEYSIDNLRKEADEILSSKERDSFFKEVFFETKEELYLVYENFRFTEVSRKIKSGFSVREVKPGADRFSAKSRFLFPANLELSERSVMRLLRKSAGTLKDAKSFRIFFHAERRVKFIRNSLGVEAFDDSVKLYLGYRITVEKNGEIGTARETMSGEKISDFQDLEEFFLKGAKRAEKFTKGAVKISGKMPVVLMSSAGGVFVHECIGHAVEADHIAKGLSVFQNKLGEKVGSEIVNIVDDPTYPGQRGTHTIDDEGVKATRRNEIVKDGVLVGFISDMKYSFLLGIPPTSSGKRESYEFPAIPRMTNTIMLPGKDNPRDIIKSAWKGILIKKLDGGEVNTATGDFVFGIEEGYVIEQGKVGSPIKKGVLMGKADESLMRIVMLGKDLGFSPGTCGKEGQWVPVSDAQPTTLFEELIVGLAD